ncbi:MAG: fibronectin type III domain-containing protein [Saprospiraceae bacterium]|nr:fibronectin type III domain-containing protein [Saprospiraceae bacterium]
MFLTIFACDKWDFDRTAFIQIITVGAIEVGSNDAFLLGDIDGLRNTEITETGFVLSSNISEDQRLRLNQSGVVQVASPVQPDTLISQDQAFAARITGLDPNTKYYFRAYAKLQGGESAYGVVDTFTTSNLIISLPSIIKNEAGCPATTTITIETEGFTATGTGIAGVVWSEDENNEIPTLSAGNILEGAADASGSFSMTFEVECDRTYFLRGFVTRNGETSYGKMLAFTTVEGGIWLPKSSFPGPVGDGAMLYSNNANGYVSGGTRNLAVGEIWSYQEDLDQWDLTAQSQ